VATHEAATNPAETESAAATEPATSKAATASSSSAAAGSRDENEAKDEANCASDPLDHKLDSRYGHCRGCGWPS